MRFQRELLLCSNHKTDETLFLNLFEGTYNEFNITKTAVEFVSDEPETPPQQCKIISDFPSELVA